MFCLQVKMSQVNYNVISTTSLWAPDDTLFQVLQWQNVYVPALPSIMTMVQRLVAR